jgi:hypothetical protein
MKSLRNLASDPENSMKLYRLPRGWERFQEYLRLMLTNRRDDVLLPPLIFKWIGKCSINSMREGGAAPHALCPASG